MSRKMKTIIVNGLFVISFLSLLASIITSIVGFQTFAFVTVMVGVMTMALISFFVLTE